MSDEFTDTYLGAATSPEAIWKHPAMKSFAGDESINSYASDVADHYTNTLKRLSPEHEPYLPEMRQEVEAQAKQRARAQVIEAGAAQHEGRGAPGTPLYTYQNTPVLGHVFKGIARTFRGDAGAAQRFAKGEASADDYEIMAMKEAERRSAEGPTALGGKDSLLGRAIGATGEAYEVPNWVTNRAIPAATGIAELGLTAPAGAGALAKLGFGVKAQLAGSMLAASLPGAVEGVEQRREAGASVGEAVAKEGISQALTNGILLGAGKIAKPFQNKFADFASRAGTTLAGMVGDRKFQQSVGLSGDYDWSGFAQDAATVAILHSLFHETHGLPKDDQQLTMRLGLEEAAKDYAARKAEVSKTADVLGQGGSYVDRSGIEAADNNRATAKRLLIEKGWSEERADRHAEELWPRSFGNVVKKEGLLPTLEERGSNQIVQASDAVDSIKDRIKRLEAGGAPKEALDLQRSHLEEARQRLDDLVTEKPKPPEAPDAELEALKAEQAALPGSRAGEAGGPTGPPAQATDLPEDRRAASPGAAQAAAAPGSPEGAGTIPPVKGQGGGAPESEVVRSQTQEQLPGAGAGVSGTESPAAAGGGPRTGGGTVPAATGESGAGGLVPKGFEGAEGPYRTGRVIALREWKLHDEYDAAHPDATHQEIENAVRKKIDGERGPWVVVASSRHAPDNGAYSRHGSEIEAHSAMMKAKQELENTGITFSVEHISAAGEPGAGGLTKQQAKVQKLGEAAKANAKLADIASSIQYGGAESLDDVFDAAGLSKRDSEIFKAMTLGGETEEAVGKRFGLTKGRIQQIQEEAFAKLGKPGMTVANTIFARDKAEALAAAEEVRGSTYLSELRNMDEGGVREDRDKYEAFQTKLDTLHNEFADRLAKGEVTDADIAKFVAESERLSQEDQAPAKQGQGSRGNVQRGTGAEEERAGQAAPARIPEATGVGATGLSKAVDPTGEPPADARRPDTAVRPLAESAKTLPERVREQAKKVRNWLQSFGQKSFPALTDASEDASITLSAASNAANTAKARKNYYENLFKIGGTKLADMTPEESRLYGATWAERAVRHYRDWLNSGTAEREVADHLEKRFQDKMQELMDDGATATAARRRLKDLEVQLDDARHQAVLREQGKETEFSREAKELPTFVGAKDSPLTDESVYQASRETMESFWEAVKQEWTPYVEGNFKDIKGMSTDDPIYSPSQIPGLPLNMIAHTEGALPPGAVGPLPAVGTAGFAGQGLENIRIRKPGFMKQRTFGAEAYDVDLRNMMERTLNQGISAATRAQAVRAGIKEGTLAKVGKGEDAPKDWRPLELKPAYDLGDLDPQARYFARPDVYREYVRGLRIGERPGHIAEGFKAFGNWIYKLQTLSPVDVLSHVNNMARSLKAEGMPATAIKDIVTDGYRLMKNDPTLLEGVAKLSELGASFEHTTHGGLLPFAGKYDPTKYMADLGSGLIDLVQKSTRLQLEKAYDRSPNLQKSGTSKRDFINQFMGNYDSGSQNSMVQFLRDTGVNGFAVAMSTGLTQGTKTAFTGATNAKAVSAAASAQIRAKAFAKLIPFLASGPIINYLKDGEAFPDDVPAFAIKTGEENGKIKFFDPIAWTGIRRGWRAVGASGAAKSFAKGETSGQAADKAFNEVWGTGSHLLSGPATQFLETVRTGENAIGHRVAPKVSTATTPAGRVHAAIHGLPEPGSNQTWLNTKAALANVNPAVAALADADRPKTPRTITEELMKMLGPFGEQERDTKSFLRKR
jgi:hypothetical protein